MVRPCFLVVDREHAGSISTRKLVIETAKLNVITAYNGREAIATFERFPAVDGVILDTRLEDIACDDVIRTIKQGRPGVPIIVIGSSPEHRCDGADHMLESFEPARLLALLMNLNAAAAALLEKDEQEQMQERT